MSKFTKGLGIAAFALVVSAGGALAHGGHGGGWRGGVADCGARMTSLCIMKEQDVR